MAVIPSSLRMAEYRTPHQVFLDSVISDSMHRELTLQLQEQPSQPLTEQGAPVLIFAVILIVFFFSISIYKTIKYS